MNTYYIKNLIKFKEYVDSRGESIPTHDLSKLFWYSTYDFGKNEYNPTTILQLGIYYVEEGNVSESNSILNWLETNLIHDKRGINWEYQYPYPTYRLSKYFTSGMTQGLALSFLIRAKAKGILHKSKYHIIDEIYDNLDNPLNLHVTTKEILPIQEFPSKPASNVLNGYIFFLFGLLDAKKFELDQKNMFEHYFEILDRNIHRFKLGKQSVYDTFKTEIDQGYLDLHIEQLYNLLIVKESLNISNYLLEIEWKKNNSFLMKKKFQLIRIVKQLRLLLSI